MATKNITVTLIKVIAPISAAPGDELMVLGDVCIGLAPSLGQIESDSEPQPRPAPVVSRPRVVAKKAANKKAPAPKPPKAAKIAKYLPRSMPPGVNRDKVMACFKQPEDTLTNEDIARMTGLTGSNAYYHANTLIRENKLAKVLVNGQVIYALAQGEKANVEDDATPVPVRHEPQPSQPKVTEEQILSQFKLKKTLTSLDLYSALNLDDANKRRAYSLLRNLAGQGRLISTKPNSTNPGDGIIYHLNEMFGHDPSISPMV